MAIVISHAAGTTPVGLPTLGAISAPLSTYTPGQIWVAQAAPQADQVPARPRLVQRAHSRGAKPGR
jgi:hypothetical protein